MEVKRKSDLNYQNDKPEEFIPFACYFDDETILTKNGELLQTIKLEGIAAEKISSNLSSLRDKIRESMQAHFISDKIAVWFHTVRAKDNIDDDTEYKNIFADKVHKFWAHKNYWDDKYTNDLYITFVHSASSSQAKILGNLKKLLSINILSESHKEYLYESHKELNEIVNKIFEDLKEYNPRKFKIYVNEEDVVMSPHLSLFKSLTQFHENKVPLPICDLSEVLGDCTYHLGNNKLQAISSEADRYCSMISLKEYSETSANSLDPVLCLPIEMVITEVIYIIPQSEAQAGFERQNYILSVSGDEKLAESKEIATFFDKNTKELFANRQIMISIMANDPEDLDYYINSASTCLNRLGMVHVREDIMLAHSFWSQLPGNFTMLHRLYPDRLKNAGAFAFLHQQELGYQYNRWGKAITLMRSEGGSPFFFSFHPEGGRSGHTGIFATPSSGKESLLNFLLSESSKYNPTVLYITGYTSSTIFAAAVDGEVTYISSKNIVCNTEESATIVPESTINPFLVEDCEEARKYVSNLLHILLGHFYIPLNEDELEIAEVLVDHIFTLDYEDRDISFLDKSFDFKQNDHAEKLYFRLEHFFSGNKYFGMFSASNSTDIVSNKINMFELSEFTNDYFEKYQLPKDPKLKFQYEKDLKIFSDIRTAILLCVFFKLIQREDKGPFIFALDPFLEFSNHPYFAINYDNMMDQITDHNGIMLVTLNIWNKVGSEEQSAWRKKFRAKLDTKLYLASEALSVNLREELGLNQEEFDKLKSILPHTRLFLNKQRDRLSVLELSLGGFPNLLTFLSADKATILDYQNTQDKEAWWEKLYKELI